MLFICIFLQASLLGIAYGATCGGIATLVGTIPNAIFAGLFKDEFPGGPEISFVSWFVWAAPIAVVMLLSAWGVLTCLYLRGIEITLEKETLRQELRSLGPIHRDEIAIALALLVMVILFLIRPYLLSPYVGFCTVTVNGTNVELFGVDEAGCSGTWTQYISDGTIACLSALILFFVPSLDPKQDVDDIGTEDEGIKKRPHRMILTQKAFFKIRWYVCD